MSTERSTLTAREAADFLGISYWKLLELTKKNQIPFVKIGSRKLFRKQTLELWMSEKENEGAEKEKPAGYGQLRRLEEKPRHVGRG